MNDEITDQLDTEISKGRSAKKAYEMFFRPFIDNKRKLIYMAFDEVKPTDTESLVELKRHSMALSLLESEMKSYIETGKMAELQLSEIVKKH